MIELRRLAVALAVTGFMLLLPGCPGSATGSGDGGTGATVGDAGATTADAGAADAGAADAGAADAGAADGGQPDLCAGVDCSSLDDACNTGVCNPGDGTCAKQPVADGTVCDDGNPCTNADQCTGGTCAGTAVDCSSSGDACHTGVCDAATGACTTAVVADGTVCDDGDPCTTSDQCTGGTCAGTAVDCTGATDQCNTGACDATTGTCVATPVADGTSCLTGNLCSWHDACASGTCTNGFVGDCGPTTLTAPGTDTTTVAGGTGGSPFTDDCPLGQVPIGIQGQVSSGTYNAFLDHVSVICGTPSISGATVTLAPGATVPATGGEGTWSTNTGPVEQHLCPSGQVAVGYSGATGYNGGTAVTEITLQCAPLGIVGSSTTGFGLTVGAAAATSTLGTLHLTPVPTTSCPAGMVARGITGRAADVLDAFGMTCGKPALEIVTTSPMGGTGGGSGGIQDCPEGQVPIGIAGSESNSRDYSQELTQVTVTCGTVAVTSDGHGGWTTSITPGATLPDTGTWGSYPGSAAQTVYCPSNEAVVGLTGSQGHGLGASPAIYIQQATLRCAPLVFTGDPTQGITVGYDSAAIGEQTLGNLTGTTFGPYDCPAGTVARGVLPSAGWVLYGLALRCSSVIPVVQ